ncbi:transcriptional regulator MirA [Blastochloris viridis]|uniref:Transcriptional regulator MirA n=1 Tax=Blastochloris viridis TaxID=1079 RepID=A0A0S4Q231_BLAVI|nr:transcriptional regulator MirA [Blastochloris viridis]
MADDLDLPQHVLRFWETRFSQIKPLKRGGGRRYYRPDDVELLRGIRHLLYGEGYTIRGVQRILKEEGVRFVQTVWREPAPAAEPDPALSEPRVMTPIADDAPPRHEPAVGQAPRPAAEPAHGRAGLLGLLPKLSRDSEPPALPRVVEVPIPSRKEPEPDDAASPPFHRPDDGAEAPAARPPFEPALPRPAAEPAPHVLPLNAQPEAAPGQRRLARDTVRRLQTTLRELQECRRILDDALVAGREP